VIDDFRIKSAVPLGFLCWVVHFTAKTLFLVLKFRRMMKKKKDRYLWVWREKGFLGFFGIF